MGKSFNDFVFPLRMTAQKLKIRESEAVEKLRQTESACENVEAELREIERQESEQDKEEEQLSFLHPLRCQVSSKIN